MITVTRNNEGQIVLIRIDGVTYTADALRELVRWAKRRREADRQASARYEEKVGRATRNAQRATRKGAKR